jgi:hypothetical protein
MEDSALPAPDAMAENQPAYKNEVTVNASTLAEGDNLPEPGDEVELTVKGTVARVSGDTVCVTPVEVNGEPAPPVPPAEAAPAEEDMDSQRERLRAGAQEEDKLGSYA